MQIGTTRWYTAKLIRVHQIAGSERSEIEHINGYRMKIPSDWSDEEIDAHIKLLAADGVTGKLKTEKQNHTDIPAGELFFQVSEKDSIKRLEKIFKDSGINLNPNRFRIGYTKEDR